MSNNYHILGLCDAMRLMCHTHLFHTSVLGLSLCVPLLTANYRGDAVLKGQHAGCSVFERFIPPTSSWAPCALLHILL